VHFRFIQETGEYRCKLIAAHACQRISREHTVLEPARNLLRQAFPV
jgi:hypothetical protein